MNTQDILKRFVIEMLPKSGAITYPAVSRADHSVTAQGV